MYTIEAARRGGLDERQPTPSISQFLFLITTINWNGRMDLGSRSNALSIVTHQTSPLSSTVAGVRGTKMSFE
jgi:hypothetical protein